MVVAVETSGSTVHASTPVRLLAGPYLISGPSRNYDVSADGRRFVMIKESQAAQPSLILVQHWDEELKRLAPVK
jgi:hypothetical protein